MATSTSGPRAGRTSPKPAHARRGAATPKPTSRRTRLAPASAEERARVVELYRTQGLAEAARRSGRAKSTIRTWAVDAGVEPAEVSRVAAERAQEATRRSLEVRREAVAKAREQLVQQQAQIALTASAAELEYLTAYREAVASARQDSFGAVGVSQLARLQAAMSGPRLSELVGAKTRAIHDLQLLDGQATEQPEGGLTVRFATPAPVAASNAGALPGPAAGPDLRVIELPAAPQREAS